MQESVIYQDIQEKGKQKATLSLCMLLLNQRFGDLESSIVEKVNVLPVEKLEALCVALLSISQLDDLITWLEENSYNH